MSTVQTVESPPAPSQTADMTNEAAKIERPREVLNVASVGSNQVDDFAIHCILGRPGPNC